MTRPTTGRFIAFSISFVFLLGFVNWLRFGISPVELPTDEVETWALASLENGRLGDDISAPPSSYSAAGPIFVSVWIEGLLSARFVGETDLESAIRQASEAFSQNERLVARPAWRNGEARFTVELTLGEGPVGAQLPLLEALGLVPLREGLGAELDGERTYITAEELRADGMLEGGIPTPVPDLSVGAPVPALIRRMGRQLHADPADFEQNARVWRYLSHTIAEADYPREVEVSEETLTEAATEGAEFLLRHQRSDGRYTYIYDARTGGHRAEAYNLPRHSGTTYFLAQVAQAFDHADARAGALRALEWLERTKMRQCGENPCIESYGRADVGSAALTVVAAAELVKSGDSAIARRLVTGLSAFLRSLQREDGELMHEFNLERQEPIDVQHMYYSGEAAFALLKAHEAYGDEANLEAARRLMTHLTGAGWDFFGSRYYYGEEHWTCIAGGEARERVNTDGPLDFCGRWFEFNDLVQFRAGQTPWASEGSYGVGPIIVPRITPVGSRTEAFISTYQLYQHHGRDSEKLRALVERGLRMLMRWRWAPGPTHLFADPEAARGGLPGSPIDLSSRNDFVQHGGSAMVRWIEVLRAERAAARE